MGIVAAIERCNGAVGVGMMRTHARREATARFVRRIAIRRATGFAAMLLCIGAGGAGAQALRWVPPGYPAACLEHIPSSAFTRVGVYGVVDLTDSASTQFASSADNLLQLLADKLQATLGAKPNELPQGEPLLDWLRVDAPLHFVAYRDGRMVTRVELDSLLSKVSLPKVAAPPTIASLFARTLDSMSTIGLFDWSADSARDSIRFDIDFVRPTLDSAGKVNQPTFRRTGLLLLSVMAPWEEPVRGAPGNRAPKYPEGARWQWYEGNVLLQFVVDTTGHPIASSIHDLWRKETPRLTGDKAEKYQEFVDNSTSAVKEMEFIPAKIGGCKVPQLVQMPFVFQLRR